MFIHQIGRGRRGQVARNLTIAVATAALAGTGAAMAAGGGGAPPATKETVSKSYDRAPLAENDPIVVQARAGLDRLVADGRIEQAEADVVMQGVIAGRVDSDALVSAGKVSAAHMAAIDNVLREVKRANAAPGG